MESVMGSQKVLPSLVLLNVSDQQLSYFVAPISVINDRSLTKVVMH